MDLQATGTDMIRRAAEKNQINPTSEKTKGAPQILSSIFIIGPNSFQNQLLKIFLENEIDRPCEIQTGRQWEPVQADGTCGQLLILFDCFGLSPSDIWIKLDLNNSLNPTHQPVALFNASKAHGLDFEKQAIAKRLRGIFYVSDAPGRLPQGIIKMLQGEIWYSRKTTSHVILEQAYRSRTEAAEAMLTAREKEILIAIASGAANSDIAEEFHISLHTVKSHIYNTYKKIDVSNRLEATLWVARYL